MNKNINNHNGKEIHKDSEQKNLRREGSTKPVDRIRKKNPGSEKEIQQGDPKKVPNIQRNTKMINQKAPNAQAVGLENKDKRIYPKNPLENNNQSQVTNPNRTSSNGKSFVKQPTASTTTADNSQRDRSATVGSKESLNTTKYLYVIAAVLFIAWIIGFFFYNLGANVHMLLALAIVVGIISFLQGRKK